MGSSKDINTSAGRIGGCAHRLCSAACDYQRTEQNQWNLWAPCFPGKFSTFFVVGYFFFFHTVSTPVFLFNFSDKLPSLPWATHEVGHEASSPDRTSTLYLCYISECLGVCFLLTRTLGVGLHLEEKTGACAGGENHTWGFSAQRVNKNSPGHITSRI